MKNDFDKARKQETMSYPKFYRNTGWKAMVTSNKTFMEVKTLKGISQVTIGENKMLTEDIERYGAPSNQEEFEEALKGFETRIDELVKEKPCNVIQ